MPPSAHAITADFQRTATVASAAVERADPVVQRLVAAVPLRSRVLEIGCGTGTLARELATRRGARITAIDLCERSIEIARVRTRPTLGIDFRVADFMELSPRGFDVVIATDTLTELPLALSLERMADAVVAGGQVMLADRFAERGVLAAPYNALCSLCSRRRTESHLALGDVRAVLRATFRRVSLRRHLGWRFTAICSLRD